MWSMQLNHHQSVWEVKGREEAIHHAYNIDYFKANMQQ